jgi:hypothetical protein
LFEFNFNKRPLVVTFDPYNNIVLKEATTSIGVENISTIVPGKYNLFQNYPNPFNSSTIIKFDLAKPGNTELVLYDIQGREVEIPVNQYLDAGSYMVKLSSENLASGFYIYRIISGNFIETRKLVIIK